MSSPTVDRARDQVLAIPVWTHFTHIPSVLRPLIGPDWLASLIGKLKCFDANTVARKSLVYTKAMIKITSDRLLPSQLKLHLANGHDAVIEVNYSWKPDICTAYHSFGHSSNE